MSDKKIRCKNCGSTQTYVRIVSMERVCKTCGNVQKIEIEKEEE